MVSCTYGAAQLFFEFGQPRTLHFSHEQKGDLGITRRLSRVVNRRSKETQVRTREEA